MITITIPETRGGPRKNAGRPEVEDKKHQVAIGVKKSWIDALGGKKAVQKILQETVEKAYNELPK